MLEAYPENQALREHPWTELKKSPQNYWANKNNRIKEIKGLVNKIRTEGKQWPTQDDFYNNSLKGILNHHNSSPLSALLEAFPLNKALLEHPWTELKHVPNNYWSNKDNRDYAREWLKKKIGKENLTSQDYENYGLSGLYQLYGLN